MGLSEVKAIKKYYNYKNKRKFTGIMTEKNVICVVLVAIIKDNNILLLKREKEPFK